MTNKLQTRRIQRRSSPTNVTSFPADGFVDTCYDNTTMTDECKEDCSSQQFTPSQLPAAYVNDKEKLGTICTPLLQCPGKALHSLFFAQAGALFWRLAITFLSFWRIRKVTCALIPSFKASFPGEYQESYNGKTNPEDSTVESCYETSTKPLLSALPENTFAIAIDDSNLQRKLLGRYMKSAGVSEDRRLVLGSSAEEIYGFDNTVVGLIREHVGDVFLLIVDENLDIDDGPTKGDRVSGSLCIQRILSKLNPEESRRILALVRSANDSPKDLEKYTARAHGYLLKTPIKGKTEILKLVSPWWAKRFGPNEKTHKNLERCVNL